jgi:hypothetical protein
MALTTLPCATALASDKLAKPESVDSVCPCIPVIAQYIARSQVAILWLWLDRPDSNPINMVRACSQFGMSEMGWHVRNFSFQLWLDVWPRPLFLSDPFFLE